MRRKTASGRSFLSTMPEAAQAIPPFGIQSDAGAGLAVSYGGKKTG